MSPLLNLLLLICEIWLLSGILLILHWYGKKIGLTPLFVYMGGLTSALQLQALGWVSIKVGGLSFNLDSQILLPVLLFGLLIIYVINGTLWARGILVGMLLLTLFAALFQILLPVHVALPGGVSLLDSTPGYTPRILIASIVAFSFDLIILILVYQTLSNLRKRFPSRLAGGLALLVALWSDAILFALIGLEGGITLGQDVLTHLVGKSIAGLAIFPLLIFYLKYIAPKFPDSAAAFPRPTLDFFTTSMQLEARASHHYRLLKTLSEINKLVYSTTNAHTLLQQACYLIAKSRDYLLVCIARSDGDTVAEFIQVGHKSINVDKLFSFDDSPCHQAFTSQKAVVFERIETNNTTDYAWYSHLEKLKIQTVAVFPMRYTGKVYGTLNLFSKHPIGFDPTEIEILENLADDLAYGLVSIQAHERQAILMTAAETMQDGLLIADLEGNLMYVNSIVARIIGLPAKQIVGQNIANLLSAEQASEFEETLNILLRRGRLTLEIEYHSRLARNLIISSHSAVVKNENGQPQHIVINIRDITHHRHYENQLLTLNRLTTDLVQIRDLQELMEKTLQISEEMLSTDASLLYLLTPSQNKITDILAHDLPDELVQSIKQGEGELALNTSAPIFVEEISKYPTYFKHLGPQSVNHLRSILVLPICLKDTHIGVLMLFFKVMQASPEDQSQLGRTLAQTLAIIIQNARLYQAEQYQHQLAEALIQAAGSLNSSLDLEEVLDIILDQVMQVVPCQAANIMMVADGYGYVHRFRGYKKYKSYTKTIKSIRIPISNPNIQSMLSGNFVLVSNTQNNSSWEIYSGSEWIKSYVGIPLKIDQEVIGFLNVNSDIPDFFTEETAHQLQTFADHAAIAYRNADLYQQLQDYALELETRVQNRTAELKAAKEHIEGILTSVPDAVFVLDQNHELIQSNDAGNFLLKSAKATSKDLFSIEFLASAKKTGTPNLQNLLEVDGRSYQALASEIHFDEKQPSGHVIIFRDVTHFKELDQLKSKFVSDVSHELRTPLTNMSLYLEFLDNDRVQGIQRTYLDILKRETERLTILIEDLLTFSRLQVGKMNGDIQQLDVNQIVEQMTVDRAYFAAKHEIQLECRPLVQLPPAMGDENWLSQALANLLTNAINYTPAKGKVILQTNVKGRHQHNWVVIEVIDNGVGIAETEISHIFDRFYRGAASQVTGAEGTGLGLAISKELITRMGGDITVNSKLGEGSTFTIWLRPAVSAML